DQVDLRPGTEAVELVANPGDLSGGRRGWWDRPREEREAALQASGAHQRPAIGQHACRPHGHRVLEWARGERIGVDAQVLTLVANGLTVQQPPEDVQGLVEHATALPSVDQLAERAELAPRVAPEADADDHPPA